MASSTPNFAFIGASCYLCGARNSKFARILKFWRLPCPHPLIDRDTFLKKEWVTDMFFHTLFHFHQCMHLDASAGRETINVTTFKISGDPICTMLKFRLDRCTGGRNNNHKFERNLIFFGLPYPQPQRSVKKLAMQKRTEPSAPNFTLISA